MGESTSSARLPSNRWHNKQIKRTAESAVGEEEIRHRYLLSHHCEQHLGRVFLGHSRVRRAVAGMAGVGDGAGGAHTETQRHGEKSWRLRVRRLAEDPELVIVVRPGLVLHFRHLVWALLAHAAPEDLTGSNAGSWCELLERVSRILRLSVAHTVPPLLATLCDHPELFSREQRTAAGLSARRLLEFAWSQVPRDSWLAVRALQCVCRTFESEPSASASLIRRCLKSEHLAQFGFEEMPWLAGEVKRLIQFDPALVAEATWGQTRSSTGLLRYC